MALPLALSFHDSHERAVARRERVLDLARSPECGGFVSALHEDHRRYGRLSHYDGLRYEARYAKLLSRLTGLGSDADLQDAHCHLRVILDDHDRRAGLAPGTTRSSILDQIMDGNGFEAIVIGVTAIQESRRRWDKETCLELLGLGHDGEAREDMAEHLAELINASFRGRGSPYRVRPMAVYSKLTQTLDWFREGRFDLIEKRVGYRAWR